MPPLRRPYPCKDIAANVRGTVPTARLLPRANAPPRIVQGARGRLLRNRTRKQHGFLVAARNRPRGLFGRRKPNVRLDASLPGSGLPESHPFPNVQPHPVPPTVLA